MLTVGWSPTNSAIVWRPMPRTILASARTTSWSVREPGRLRMKSPSIFRWLKGSCLRY